MGQNANFIGTGRNPNGPDLPLGFGMQLAQEPDAMKAYGRLTNEQKSSVIHKMQTGSTGDEAKNLIAETILKLKDGGTF